MTSKLVTEVISYLGRYGRDLITGAEGVVTSVSFDIGGHIQIELNRGLDSDGKPFEAY